MSLILLMNLTQLVEIIQGSGSNFDYHKKSMSLIEVQ